MDVLRRSGYQVPYSFQYNPVHYNVDTGDEEWYYNDHQIGFNNEIRGVRREDVMQLRRWIEDPMARAYYSDITLPGWFPYRTTDQDIRMYTAIRTEQKDEWLIEYNESGASMEGYEPNTVEEYEHLVNEAYERKFFSNN